MIVFSSNEFTALAKCLKGLPGFRMGSFISKRHPNGELFINVKTKVEDKECVITGTIAPPDENLISLLLLSHTLKKEKASKIVAFLPYLAYSRQDKSKPGESLATSATGEILRSSHISDIVSIDLHSHKAEALIPIPVHNLSPALLFAAQIKKLKLKNPTFVAPDEGAQERLLKVKKYFSDKTPTTFMKKQRKNNSVSSVMVGKVGKDAVVIDDVLDTGSTLISCCQNLMKAGAKHIYVFVTHGLFTGNEWKLLFNLGVKTIYCTDSTPQAKELNQKRGVRIISLKPLLEDYAVRVRRINNMVEQEERKFHEEADDETLLTSQFA